MAPEEVDNIGYESKQRRSDVLARIEPLAEQEIRELLAEAQIEADTRDIEEIIKAVQERLEDLRKRKGRGTSAGRYEGRRFFELKRQAVEGQLAPLRPIGKQYLYFADLPSAACRQLESGWSVDWTLASKPWGQIDGSPWSMRDRQPW